MSRVVYGKMIRGEERKVKVRRRSSRRRSTSPINQTQMGKARSTRLNACFPKVSDAQTKHRRCFRVHFLHFRIYPQTETHPLTPITSTSGASFLQLSDPLHHFHLHHIASHPSTWPPCRCSTLLCATTLPPSPRPTNSRSPLNVSRSWTRIWSGSSPMSALPPRKRPEHLHLLAFKLT